MRLRLLLVATFLFSATIPAAHGKNDTSPTSTGFLQGRFDNGSQAAKAPADPDHAIAHVTILIEPTADKNFSLWHMHLETDPKTSFDQTWAMETRIEHDGSSALIPYYQFKQTSEPVASAFDQKDWLSLEACALRGRFTKTRIEGMSEGEPCVAVSMNVGARRALLPVGILREGDWLHVDLNLRGVRTRIDARRT
jgi:hypothetical protein